MHQMIIPSENLEIDLYIPELKTIIEVDGPQHFLPIFGEEKLSETIKLDSTKNGLLISKGFCVIRIKYLCKSWSRSVGRKLWDLVYEEVRKVQDKFPPKTKRFIELEIK